MLKHTKRVRRITYIIGFTSVILGLATIITVLVILEKRKAEAANSTSSTPETCQELVEQVIRPAEFVTVIEHVTHNDECFATFYIKPAINGVGKFCVCPGLSLPDMFFQPGDTIKSKAGSSILTIVTPDGKNVITYEYPCCAVK